jgi:lipoate-protein ligase A
MENWRFIPYQTSSAALNMAIDEAIMKAHREGKVPPTLLWNKLDVIFFLKRVDDRYILC